MAIDLSQWIPSAIEPWVENRFVHGMLIMVAAFVGAFIVDRVFARGLLRLTRRTATDVDDRIVNLLHRPIYWMFILAGISLALDVVGLPETASAVIRRTAKTVIVLLWALALVGIVRVFLGSASLASDRHRLVQPRTRPLLENLAFILVFGAAIYFVLVSWKVDVTGWVASAGVAGLALGFAAKDTLANLFSGIFIIVDAPYKLGDFIVIDSGERGRVTDIGLRSTRILTQDDMEITIPNAIMGNSKIVNETGGPYDKERVRLKVGVSYESDAELVRDVLLKLAVEEEHVCEIPEPRVRFRAFGDSSLDFELLAWIDEPVLRGRVLDALHFRVLREFRAANIEIPFPQRDLHVKQMPGRE